MPNFPAVGNQARFIQNYTTADLTHDADTSADFPAGGTGTTLGAWDTAANRDAAISRFNTLRAEVLDLKQLVNALINQLRDKGIVG